MRRVLKAFQDARDTIGVWMYSLQHVTALIMLLTGLSLYVNPTPLITELGDQTRVPLAGIFATLFSWAGGALWFRQVSWTLYFRMIFIILLYGGLLTFSALFVLHATLTVPIYALGIWALFAVVARIASGRLPSDPGTME